jgi:hypothetical protein
MCVCKNPGGGSNVAFDNRNPRSDGVFGAFILGLGNSRNLEVSELSFMTVSKCRQSQILETKTRGLMAQGPFDDVNAWLAWTLGFDHHQFKRLSVHFRAPQWITPSTFIYMNANQRVGPGINYITKISGPSCCPRG